MPENEPLACVITVTHDSAACVPRLLAGLRADPPRGYRRRVIVVDNASSDGTAEAVRRRFPEALLLRNDRNEGFGAACNRAARRALEEGAEYLAFVGPDTEVTPGWLEPLLRALDEDPRLASVQPLVVRADAPDRVNTRGNRIHFLGFGFAGGNGTEAEACPPGVHPCAYASGNALVVRAREFLDAGGFDEPFFLYVEDQDLGWRFRLEGRENAAVLHARVVHHYDFEKRPEKFYYLERNRWVFLFSHFQARTLLLAAPALLVTECAVWAYFLAQGMASMKCRAVRDFFRRGTLSWVKAKRRASRARRRLSDHALAPFLEGRIVFGDLPHPLLTRLLNPLLAGWWRLVRPLLPRRP